MKEERQTYLTTLYLYGGKWGKWTLLVGPMTDEQIETYAASADRAEVFRDHAQPDTRAGQAA